MLSEEKWWITIQTISTYRCIYLSLLQEPWAGIFNSVDIISWQFWTEKRHLAGILPDQYFTIFYSNRRLGIHNKILNLIHLVPRQTVCQYSKGVSGRSTKIKVQLIKLNLRCNFSIQSYSFQLSHCEGAVFIASKDLNLIEIKRIF